VDTKTLHPGDAVQQGAGDDPHAMSGLIPGVRLAVRDATRHLVRDMLDQGAAEHDVQQLLAAADSEHRHPSLYSTPGRGELEGGAAVFGLDRGMTGLGPEQRRIDVEAAPGDDEPVDAIEIRESSIGVVWQEDRQSSGTPDRIAIILADRIPRKTGIAAG